MSDHLWTAPGRSLTPFSVATHYPASSDGSERPRALQLTHYDPGSAAYRYHSAANSVEGGVSAFARYRHENPFCDLRQWDIESQRPEVSELLSTADVVHVHMDYKTLPLLGQSLDGKLLVRHYHGSQVKPSPQFPVIDTPADDELGAVQVGARLYHLRFSERCHWLPIPMPVNDYAELAGATWVPASERPNKRWRIAHSPTHSPWKGTTALQVAVQTLMDRGVPIELVMIQGKPQAEALALKATCDFTFDSFWLGIQGSGLEGACMGQVVIAGDPEARDDYTRQIGYCPYTYAEQFDDLLTLIPRLIEDEAFRESESYRVHTYVKGFHDYPVVGRKYWEMLRAEATLRGVGFSS